MSVRRPELLLSAIYAGVLAPFAQAFWMLEPVRSTLVEVSLWLIAIVCLVLAFRPRVTEPPESPRTRLLHKAAKVALGLFVVVIIGWMHVTSYVVLVLVSITAGLTAMACEAVALGVCIWWARRHVTARPLVWGVVATLLFSGAMTFVGLTTWMWYPPTAEVCDAAIDPGKVTRLSPAEWPSEPSQPYSILYIPEESWLMAAFKMGGQDTLPFWNEPTANRVWGVDLDDPSQVALLPMPGIKFPLEMAYRPGPKELLVSRMGPGVHSLDVLSLADFPKMTTERTVDVDYAPHRLVTHPDAGTFGVLGQHGEFTRVNADSLETLSSLQLERPGDHAPMAAYAWRAPGTSKVYVSLLWFPVAEIDMDTWEVRWSEVLFGGGYLAGDAQSGELYATDHFFNRVDVVDMALLEPKRRLALDYTPRPVEADASRDLLMVGDWFGGMVRFYRLSTLEPLALATNVGPYLRDFAYDAKGGRLFAASKCGVYQVNVDAVTGASR